MTNVSVIISVGSISGTTYTSTEQLTIPSSEIVKNSCELTKQLMKDLSPTVDQCKFEIVKDSPAVEWILSKDTDIRAVVYENDTVIFTGYLSDKYKWSVTSNGESTLSVTAEDFNKLLSKVYAPSDGGDVLLNGSTSTIIPNICVRAGIKAENIPSYNITKVVSSGTTCKELLKEICFEGGYVYYFTPEGNLTVNTLLPSSLTPVATLNNDDLYVVNDTAISLSKSLQQYRQANISYTKLDSRSNALVYQDISGRDSTHPNCNIEIAGGYAYPSGIEIGSHTDDELKSTTECTDLDKGMELVYIDNVKPEVTSVGSIEYSITKKNAKDLDVLVKNTTSLSKTLSKLQATADITYIASNEKVIAGLGTSDDDKVYEYECKYIHDKSLAQNLAKKIANYYKYCNYQYTFYSKQDLSLGQIVTLIDDTFSGLNVKVMPFKKVLTKNIYTYTATSVSEFDIEAKDGQSLIPSSNVNPIVGPNGATGKGITNITNYYLATDKDSGITTETSGWTVEVQKITSTNKYLWNYEKIEYTEGDPTITTPIITGTYGDKGEDAIYLKLESSVRTFKCLSDVRSYAIPYEQTVYITAETSGIEGATLEWGITSSNKDYSRYETAVLTNNQYQVKITQGVWTSTLTEAPSFTITCIAKKDGTTITTEKISISSIPSGGEEGVYAGRRETSSEAEDYIKGLSLVVAKGDSYLDISLNEDGTVKNIPMTWNGSSWTETTPDSTNYADTMNNCLADALLASDAIQEQTVLWQYCKNLGAQNALIQSLFARKISILDEGEISSKNYYDTPSPEQRFRITASGEAEFYGIQAKNAVIDGKSVFNGTINSTALSTTLEEAGAGKSYSLSLGSTKYWTYSMLEKWLDNYSYGTGYTTVYSSSLLGKSVSYLRKGTSPILVYYADGETSEVTYTCPRNQTLKFQVVSKMPSGSQYPSMVVIQQNGEEITGYGYSGPATNEYTVKASKGDTFTIGILKMMTCTVYVNVYDSTYDYPNKYTFFDANNDPLDIYGKYNSGDAIIGNVAISYYLYRSNSMSTSSGGGECNSGTLTLKSEDGSVNITDKSLYSAFWTNANEIVLTTTDLQRYVVNTSSYYQDFSTSFVLKSTVNSVQTVSITPKYSSNVIGTATNPFYEGNFVNVKGTLTGNVRGNVTGNLTGNVNQGDTSHYVYRAVFN